MFLRILRDISRPQWMAIILLLKKSQGMAVGDIAKALEMSYMGVKQHCISLEKLGYLDTWRQPQKAGRPLKLYRLTKKTAPLFPDIGSELGTGILETLKESYGSNAPEKALLSFFNQKAEAYQKSVKGKSVLEKADKLAKIREKEGYLSECVYEASKGLRIIEYHSLISELEQKYPSTARMEEQMFSKILNAPVDRHAETVSGLARIRYEIKTL